MLSRFIMNTWIIPLLAFLAVAVFNSPTLAQTPTAVTDTAATPMATPATPAFVAEMPAADPEPNANMRMAVEEAPAGPAAAPFLAQVATGMTPAAVPSGDDVGASQYYSCYWYYAGPYYYCYYNMWGPYYYCYVSDIGCCCQPIYY
ncbi:hypothetical protein HK102_012608 [Quaeritorhiza haematococci]|nr:hypothetical protein HK102_012608 [Quaeritorhiza haematococci]